MTEHKPLTTSQRRILDEVRAKSADGMARVYGGRFASQVRALEDAGLVDVIRDVKPAGKGRVSQVLIVSARTADAHEVA